MGRIYGHGKGISGRSLAYKTSPPSWLKVSATQVVEEICALAKKGVPPSQIGMALRDNKGIGRVANLTGKSISRILRAHGLEEVLPEDLYFLIKKAVTMRKHLERARKDKNGKYHLMLVESRIHRLSRYYKRSKRLEPNWKYEAKSAGALVA